MKPTVVFVDAAEFADIVVPDRSIFEGMQALRHVHGSPILVVLAKRSDEKLLQELMHAGVRDVLLWPFGPVDVVQAAVHWDGVWHKELSRNEKTNPAMLRSIHALIAAVEAKEKYLAGFSKDVALLASRLAHVLRLPSRTSKEIVVAALLHDVGRVALRDEVVNKREQLTCDEREHLKTHVSISEKIVNNLFQNPEITASVRHHHERYDGQGYPRAMKGKEIPLGARIIGVADAYVALTQERPYRSRRSQHDSVEEILVNSGKQFCPAAVGGLVRLFGYRPDSGKAAPRIPSLAHTAMTAPSHQPRSSDSA
ncbi:MAG: HD domain-containing protein [Planctomycetes bacterium]|nr:HD domain-containing protein [Planctomycetota bacterium]